MRPERENGEFFARSTGAGGRPPGPFAKALAAIVAVVFFAVALTFSLVFVAVALGLGLIAGAWLWWKTRRVRRELDERMAEMARERPPAAGEEAGRGAVIEGEVIAVEIARDDPPRDGAPR
ncbi:MAG: LapA family protein [Rhodocyclaceae bacterium]|nr:LapA family protein [Rhodocyclaceae bacterium]